MLDPQYVKTVFFIGTAIYIVHMLAAVSLQERRYSVKRTAVVWVLAGIMLLLDIYLGFALLPEQLILPVPFILAYLYYLITFICVSADGFWKKCYLWVSYACVFTIVWSTTIYLGYIFFPDCAVPDLYVVRVALYMVIYLPVLLLYRKYGRPLIREVSGSRGKVWGMLCWISALYLIVFMLLLNRIRLDEKIRSDTLTFFLVIVCTFAAVNILSISNIYYIRKEAKAELTKQNIEYLTSYIESVSRAEQETRRIRHDKRHHDEQIVRMARMGDNEGILRFLGHEKDEIEISHTWCPHVMVNGILSSYAGKAKEAGIEFTARADTPARTEIADTDFVAILANLLENAFHACAESKNSRSVRVNIKNVGQKTVIAVSNPCDVGLKLENGMPVDRGTGIDSIVTSAARYHGELSYKVSGNICTACVILNSKI